MALRLPLGISDFRTVREEGFDYVDKSLLIRDLIDDASAVLLLPRPRRFGKTLNLSMLRYFFERSGEDRWRLFEGLAIAGAGAAYRGHFQRYPTIHLTFKDIKADGWEECRQRTAKLLARLYTEHDELLSDLKPSYAADFAAVLEGRATQTQLENALQDLSRHLYRRHGQRVLVLLDEYDTPLNAAHQHGYYEPAVTFFRNLLSTVLKDNEFLHKGVLTGVLRVAKDSIFTGLNNLDVYSVLSPGFATAFGFTQGEVEELLRRADLGARLPEVQRWYNGYLFGEQVIYNPWSVLSFLKHQPQVPRPYWADTSGNDLVRELFLEHGAGWRLEWERLLRGETIEQPIAESVALRELPGQPRLLWSILVFSGYLKVLSLRLGENGVMLGTLAIPNQEVQTIYVNQFSDWMTQGLGGDVERQRFLAALLSGDAEQVEERLAQWLLRHASYHDTAQGEQPERFYHGLVLGLLVSLGPDYEVRSNPESGFGRCDILITPRQAGRAGVVLEFKVADRRRRETLAGALKAAQAQLRERAYAEALRERGAQPVHELAVAWQGKEVRVAKASGGRTARPRKKAAPRQ